MNNEEIMKIRHGFDCLRCFEQSECFVDIGELMGKTLSRILGAEEGNDVIIFECTDGTRYMMYHDQDCCEEVSINDICGDIERLIGTPITKAADVSEDMSESYPSGGDDNGTHTWTFYHLATIRGYVTIRWFGESNGYYSEEVSFVKLP